jgi:L-ribulose-5-phosphate 3-epimerase
MRRRDYLKLISAAALAVPRAGAAPETKGRFRPAVCAYSFRRQLTAKTMTYADVVRIASDAGAEGIDLTTYWLEDTSDEAVFALKKLAYRAGIALYTIGIRAHMAQPTADLQNAQVALVQKWLDIAQKLGASHMRVFGGAVPKGATEDQAVAWAVEALKKCAEAASTKGIILGLEDDGGITTTARRTVEIVEKTASPWVGINLDIGNFPDDAYHEIEMCAKYATNVHFKSEVHVDRRGEAPDDGRILGILGKAGYHGYLALEYEASGNPLTEVPRLISKMRAAIRVANEA